MDVLCPMPIRQRPKPPCCRSPERSCRLCDLLPGRRESRHAGNTAGDGSLFPDLRTTAVVLRQGRQYRSDTLDAGHPTLAEFWLLVLVAQTVRLTPESPGIDALERHQAPGRSQSDCRRVGDAGDVGGCQLAAVFCDALPVLRRPGKGSAHTRPRAGRLTDPPFKAGEKLSRIEEHRN